MLSLHSLVGGGGVGKQFLFVVHKKRQISFVFYNINILEEYRRFLNILEEKRLSFILGLFSIS